MSGSRYSHCRFPMWPTGAEPTHVYCNMKTEPGFPYCDVHANKCYVGMTMARQEAKDQTQEKTT